jgi:hypothetical protein
LRKELLEWVKENFLAGELQAAKGVALLNQRDLEPVKFFAIAERFLDSDTEY